MKYSIIILQSQQSHQMFPARVTESLTGHMHVRL